MCVYLHLFKQIVALRDVSSFPRSWTRSDKHSPRDTWVPGGRRVLVIILRRRRLVHGNVKTNFPRSQLCCDWTRVWSQSFQLGVSFPHICFLLFFRAALPSTYLPIPFFHRLPPRDDQLGQVTHFLLWHLLNFRSVHFWGELGGIKPVLYFMAHMTLPFINCKAHVNVRNSRQGPRPAVRHWHCWAKSPDLSQPRKEASRFTPEREKSAIVMQKPQLEASPRHVIVARREPKREGRFVIRRCTHPRGLPNGGCIHATGLPECSYPSLKIWGIL